MIKKKKILSGPFGILNSGFAHFGLFRIFDIRISDFAYQRWPDDSAKWVGVGE
jgi:hypothetical protein